MSMPPASITAPVSSLALCARIAQRASTNEPNSSTASGRPNREAAHVAGRPLSNVLENVLMAMLPMGIIYTLGIMLNRLKQAWTFFWVMGGFFLVFLGIAYVGEAQNNPLLTAFGLILGVFLTGLMVGR